MTQILSGQSDPELRARWPEIAILGLSDVIKNPRLAYEAFYNINHLGVIIECPPMPWDQADIQKHLERKKSGPGTHTWFPHSFRNTVSLDKNITRRIAATYAGMKKSEYPYDTGPNTKRCLVTDLLVSSAAFGARRFDVITVSDTTIPYPHRDYEAAFAIRVSNLDDHTTIIYKHGRVGDVSYAYVPYEEGDKVEDVTVRPPANSLLLLKGTNWGEKWMTDKCQTIEQSLPSADGQGLYKSHCLGLVHYPYGSSDRVVTNYSVYKKDTVYEVMRQQPRRPLDERVGHLVI